MRVDARTVPKRFCNIRGRDDVVVAEIGYRARNFEHAVIAARGQLQLFRSVMQESARVDVDEGTGVERPPRYMRIAADPPLPRVAAPLPIPSHRSRGLGSERRRG
jgi:hypothetical protein